VHPHPTETAVFQFGQVIGNRIVDALDVAFVDCDADQSGGERLRNGTRNADRVTPIPVEIALVEQLAILEHDESMRIAGFEQLVERHARGRGAFLVLDLGRHRSRRRARELVRRRLRLDRAVREHLVPIGRRPLLTKAPEDVAVQVVRITPGPGRRVRPAHQADRHADEEAEDETTIVSHFLSLLFVVRGLSRTSVLRPSGLRSPSLTIPT